MSAEKNEIVAHKVTGTVKCYNARLGFGFITRVDTKEDICFHEAALKDNPKKAINSVNVGEVVQFDIVVGENGNEVGNVTGPSGADLGESPHVADVVARRVTGTVKRYEVKLGYGFITRSDNGEDVFVHQSDIAMDGFRSLRVGETVEFDITVGGRGTKAIHVTGPNRSPVRGTLNALRKWRETRNENSAVTGRLSSSSSYSRCVLRKWRKKCHGHGEDCPDCGEDSDSDSYCDSNDGFETIQDYLCWKDGLIEYGGSALDLLDDDFY